MQKINSAVSLKNAILELEEKQVREGKLMKMQCLNAFESAKPFNLIVSTFQDLTHSLTQSKVLKDSILSTALGVAAGYLSKNFIEEGSESPFKKILGRALMFGITNVVAQHPDTVRSFGSELMKIIEQKSEEYVAADEYEHEMDYSNT
jgi:hypothetical protein